MDQGTVLDRRTYRDRRMQGDSTYTGPERRKLRDRRSGKITVCIFCGEVCGGQKGWVKSPQSLALATDFLIDVCRDCYAKQFRHFYSRGPSPGSRNP